MLKKLIERAKRAALRAIGIIARAPEPKAIPRASARPPAAAAAVPLISSLLPSKQSDVDKAAIAAAVAKRARKAAKRRAEA